MRLIRLPIPCPKILIAALFGICASTAFAQNAPPAATTPAPAPASLTAPAPVVQATGSAIRQDNGDFYTQIYRVPTADEITAVLDRVRNFMETSTPAKLMAGGEEVTEFSQPIPGVTLERGPQFPFQLLTYEQGVVFIGMLNAAEATGDTKYNDYVVKRLTTFANYLKVAPAAATPLPGARGGRGGGLGGLTTPYSLDQCGAMCAGLLKARLANVGPDLGAVTNTWMNFIETKVPRLSDGTIARHVPMPDTIWADDMYMSVPALAWMGKLTGDKKYFDDAVKQVTQMSARLFRPEKGIYAHGWITTNPDPIDIHWARANGWCVMAMAELLDALPTDYPGRNDVLNLFRAHVRGLAARQSGSGLWHQLLDHEDTYLETSASAMFVYAMAHGVNRGWVSPAYGSGAIVGWNAVATRVNAQGGVEGTCVGTNFDLSLVYYYNRPTSVNALHGYGPVLLAGSEVLKMLHNDKITVKLSTGSIYVSPNPDQPMPWLSDGRAAK
jgi:unsaturated rhamnogalacturonyl hydrolase